MNALKGVNLGGWLQLERNIQSVVFEGTDARDEFDFVTRIAKEDRNTRYRLHRDSFMTERDFAYLHYHGIEIIRLHVPFFVFGNFPPFNGCIEYVDLAMQLAQKYNIQVLIDLRSMPGSQNALARGGITGVSIWSSTPNYIDFSKKVLIALAKRYAANDNFWGIEIIDSPISENRWKEIDIPNKVLARKVELHELSEPITQEFLETFYLDMYHLLRPILPDNVKIVMHDHYRPNDFIDFFQKNDFDGVILDVHLLLSDQIQRHKIAKYEELLGFIDEKFTAFINSIVDELPIIVGEWNLVTDGVTELEILDKDKETKIRKKLSDIQINSFKKTQAHFFANFKSDSPIHGQDFEFARSCNWI